MTTALVIGSGAAAAGAALALSRREDVKITVIDIGLRLEPERQKAVDTLASTDPRFWNDLLLQSISAQPVKSHIKGTPEKRSYGSNYPFRDVTQLDGLTAADNVTEFSDLSGVRWVHQRVGFATHAVRSIRVCHVADSSVRDPAALRSNPQADPVRRRG